MTAGSFLGLYNFQSLRFIFPLSVMSISRPPAEIAREDKNPMALLTEVMQTTYIVTTLAIILNNKRTMPDEMEMIIIK
jgi:hypothetical protein